MAYDLELSHVTKVFADGTRAVDDFNLQVQQGELIALLGPSGCGKTTTLRMIGGFEEASSGEISLRGKVVNDLPPERRPTSMIFQSYALFPHMTVGQNICYGLVLKRVPEDRRRRRLDEMLQTLDLEDLVDARVERLSGGQRQRVALARALAVEPEILLLDEPLGALDASLRERIQTELTYLQKTLGITFVLVTHSQAEALAVADRIVVMNQGRIEQVATPEALYTRPRTSFVAQFMGRNTILPGVLRSGGGDVRAVETALGVFHSSVADERLREGDEVSLVIASEVVAMMPADDLDAAGDGAGNVMLGRLERTAVVGALAQHEVVAGDGLRIRIESPAGHYADLHPGQAVVITWDARDSTVVRAA